MSKTVNIVNSTLFKEIRSLITAARSAVAGSIDYIQVHTCFEVGRRIVEHEQKGSVRAQYGKQLLADLSANLTTEFGSGFSERNLRNMRKFYLVYQSRAGQIWQMSSAKSVDVGKRQMSSGKYLRPIKPVFNLSWSQYVFLVGIILCRKNREALVDITLPKGANIHAKEYQLYLPSKEELRQKLLEWTEDSNSVRLSAEKKVSPLSRSRINSKRSAG
jgi:hypothetical protein